MNRIKSNKVKAWYIVFINAFVGCAIASTFPQFSMTVSNLSLKSGIPESILLTSDTVKSCGIVVAMLVSGFLYNKFGARKIFIYSLLSAIIPQLIFPHLTQIWLLMILKFIQGTCSVIFPVFLVIIMEWVDDKNVGLSTAIFNGIFYGGGGIGGTIAGIVIANSDWETSYYAMAAIQLVISIIWLVTVKEKPKAAAQIYEEIDVIEDKPKKNLLFTKEIWLLSLSLIATTWIVQAITVDMPLFSQSLGFSDLETGKILTAVTIGMIVSCLVSGRASDYFASKANRKGISRIFVLMFGYLLVIIAVLFIIFANTDNFMVLYIAALMLTFGGSWGLGSFYSILPEIYDEKTVPVVTGITGGIGDAGMPIAPMVVGVAFGIRGMWNIGWLTCAGIAGISILAAFVLIITLRKKS